MKNCEQLEHLFLIHACMHPQNMFLRDLKYCQQQFSATFHRHHHHLVLSFHSHLHLHHGKNLNLKLFSILSFSSSAKLSHSLLNDAILCWILLPFHENPLRRYFPSSCYSYFFSIFAFAFKKAKRYKKDSIVKAISASLWKRKEKKEIHLSNEIRDDFLWHALKCVKKRKQKGVRNFICIMNTSWYCCQFKMEMRDSWKSSQ